MADHDGVMLYMYAMDLFLNAGHVVISVPEFINHTPEQFVFFDNRQDVSLSRNQRSLFKSFDNISRLFTANGCAFFSINMLATKSTRSQLAHDFHSMIHPIIGTSGTICLFRSDGEIMLSFMGYGLQCILSDWYVEIDQDDNILEKLDIANISIQNGRDYFLDIVYSLARPYYLYSEPSVYDLLPLRFDNGIGLDEMTRDELNQYVENELNRPRFEYGDDYVDYDETANEVQYAKIGEDLDLLLLEIDEEDDDLFDVEIDKDDDFEDDEQYYDEADSNDEPRDEYEYEDVDPEIFRDPTLMVKWLNRHDNE